MNKVKAVAISVFCVVFSIAVAMPLNALQFLVGTLGTLGNLVIIVGEGLVKVSDGVSLLMRKIYRLTVKPLMKKAEGLMNE